MTGCAAPNCSNRSKPGFKLFRFPRDKERRRKWLINSRRKQWEPKDSSRLCEKHFEESQFEQFRLDKWRKLKPNAVPTIFDVPNPPKKFKSNRRVLKRPSSVLKVVVERSNLSDAKIRHVNNEDCINVNEGCSKCSQLIVENRRLLGQVLTLKEHLNNQEKKLESFLREDQREALKYPLTSGTHKWSDKTVQQCLNIRCATGANGYEYLRKIGYPAPSYQVLCNKVENIITAPGIQHTLLDWMEIKMSDLSEESHSCSLMLDEVKMTKGVDYDNNIKQFIGFTSPEFKKKLNNEVATHILCFTVKGITLEWKQVIAFYYVGDSASGKKLWRVCKNIISELGKRSFHVKSIVCDMGARNQAMWREGGILSTKSMLSGETAHPHFPNEKLRFIANCAHLLKHLRAALIKHVLIYLPENIAVKYALPTNKVSFDWIVKLVNYEKDKELKLAPKLTMKHLRPSKFEKTNIDLAAQVFSRTTGSAIKTLVGQQVLSQEALSTAFFCDYFNNWFDLMSSTSCENSLFKDSTEKIQFLLEVKDMVDNMEFGNVKTSKVPVQTGIQLSTLSIISMHEELVKGGNLDFFLTSRFMQDSLENLLSQIHGFRNPNPRPGRFLSTLKLILLAQFMQIPPFLSYDEDDSTDLISTIRSYQPSMSVEDGAEKDIFKMDLLDETSFSLSDVRQVNCIYFLAGCAVYKTLKRNTCEICELAFKNCNPDTLHNAALLNFSNSYPNCGNTRIAKFTTHLCHPSEEVINEIIKVETLFQANIAAYSEKLPIDCILKEVDFSHFSFPECHCYNRKMLQKYLKYRCMVHARFVDTKLKQQTLSGKTAVKVTVV